MGMTTPSSFSQLPLPAAALLPAVPCRRPAPWPRRGLQVTRIADDIRQPGQAGCMRISGRLADVCAELERLARLEAN